MATGVAIGIVTAAVVMSEETTGLALALTTNVSFPPPPLTVMAVRPVGVVVLFTVTVSSPVPVSRIRAALLENDIDSRLLTVTRPSVVGEPAEVVDHIIGGGAIDDQRGRRHGIDHRTHREVHCFGGRCRPSPRGSRSSPRRSCGPGL